MYVQNLVNYTPVSLPLGSDVSTEAQLVSTEAQLVSMEAQLNCKHVNTLFYLFLCAR